MEHPRQGMSTMRILLADNDPATRNLLETNLKDWGYETVSCGNGREALEALEQPDPPKLAILEWSLPEMDGLQVCRRIRELAGRAYIYIILLTEASTKDEMLKGLEAGADEYIIKPVDVNELRMRIRAGSRIVGLQETFTAVLRYSEQQAAHDPLTGLWNRAAMIDILRRELERATRENSAVGLVIGGLDQLARINQGFGSLTSDAVLREIVLRIRSCVRSYDHVGRSEDDDFIIVVPGCDLESTRVLAERLRASVSKYRLSIGEGVMPLTMSFGILVVGEGEKTDADAIMGRVEDAMRRARDRGGDRIEIG